MDVVRFGISMDPNLLARFDRRIARKGYTNRSEAIRNLVRTDLVAEEWERAEGEVVATISLVYDHRLRQLSRRLTGFQHAHHRTVAYALIETAMRRAAVTKLNLEDVDFRRKTVTVEEKGGYTHSYQISQEGLRAIQEYSARERKKDADHWQSPALFLPTATTRRSRGRLAVLAVNDIWNAVCRMAGVNGKTPHSARHAMAKHLIEKTGISLPCKNNSGTSRPPIPCNTPASPPKNWARSWMNAKPLSALSEYERGTVLTRFRLLQPHLEGGVPLAQLARVHGLPLRTLQRWVELPPISPKLVTQFLGILLS